MIHTRGALRTLALFVVTVVLASATPASAEPAATQSVVAESSVVTEAGALARARATGEPVVVESLTTETQQTRAMPDGTMQLEVNATPVRVKRGNGWVPVDTDLVEGKGGFFVPGAASTPVEFSPGGTVTLARIQTSTGAWLEEVSPFGVLPAPSIEGAVATYSEVLPGVDIQLTATEIGMSEVIVVKNAKAAANPALAAVKFVVAGATVKATSGGGIVATAPDGSSLRSGTPTWWDSSYGSTADGPRGNASPELVSQSTSKTSVVLDVAAATKSRAVTYPVFIDPDWTGGVSSFWYTDKAYPTTTYLNGVNAGGEQRVGYVSAAYSPDARNHTARAYWRMSTSGINGKHVTAAVFSVTETWAFNCTPSVVNLWTVGNASPGATYNQSGGYTYGGPIASANVAHRAGGAGACAQAAVGFSATGAVQTVAANQAGYLDLALVASTETANSGWKRFGQGASLTISYNSFPSVPVLSVASPARTCGTVSDPARLNSTAGVVLQSVLADVDAGASVRAEFKVGLVGSLPASPNYLSAYGAVGTRTVSITGLSTGNYAYQARAYDGVDVSAYSGLCYFSVDNAAPPLPTQIALTEPSPLVVGQPMPFQFSADPADGVAAFAYWWTPTASSYPGPPAPILTGAVPACGSSAGAVYFVCPDAFGVSPVITAAPIDVLSTLWVTSFDDAGNAGTDGTAYAVPREVYAGADTAAYSFSTGHGWFTDALTLPLTGPIDDSNVNTSGGTTAGSSITLGTGTSTTTRVIDPLVGAVPVILFAGPASQAASLATTTSSSVVDISQSFTASTWVDRDIPQTNTGVYYVLSATSATTPAFSLRVKDSKWQFCVTFPASPSTETCVEDPATASPDMVLLTGIWDAGNRQLRLIVGSSAGTAITKAVAVATPTVPTVSPLVFGSAISGANSVGTFRGVIGDPIIFPGVATSDEVLDFFYLHTISS